MLEKFPGENAAFNIDCSDMLSSGVTIVGTPAMSFFPALTAGDALTIGAASVNTQPVTYTTEGGVSRTAPAGTVIQVKISGGSVPAKQSQRIYSVIASFNASNGDALVAKALLAVLTTEPT